MEEAFEPDPIVSGGTTAGQTLTFESWLTEIRPGTYVYNDVNELKLGVAALNKYQIFARWSVDLPRVTASSMREVRHFPVIAVARRRTADLEWSLNIRKRRFRV
jgi:D-serine deaminase-like pyridoxal phosphate-dependent protein